MKAIKSTNKERFNMETSLDKRLKEIDKCITVRIQNNPAGFDGAIIDARLRLTNGVIEQIKQAFKDEKYIQIPKEVEETWRTYNHMAGFMTGQEWYDRFIKELIKLHGKELVGTQEIHIFEVMKAAKKASGIE